MSPNVIECAVFHVRTLCDVGVVVCTMVLWAAWHIVGSTWSAKKQHVQKQLVQQQQVQKLQAQKQQAQKQQR